MCRHPAVATEGARKRESLLAATENELDKVCAMVSGRLRNAPAGKIGERARKVINKSEMPVWMELYDSLREQGVLVSTGRLHPVDVATTIRQRGTEPEIVDGPFAVTKEATGPLAEPPHPSPVRRRDPRPHHLTSLGVHTQQ